MSSSPAPSGRRRPVFMRLGILVVRHPWYPVIFWLILLAVSVPAAMRSSTATTANATGLPDSYPSVVASHEMNALFPNSSPASTSLLVLYGTNFTGATGRDSILSLGTALAGNTSLTTLANVTSLYAAYESYLYGEVRLALGIWIQADSSSPNVTAAVQGTAELVWGPPSLYLTNWEALVAQHANQSPLAQNYPAFVETNASLNGTPGLQANLSRFYYGLPGISGGFNGTPGCGGAPSTAPNCSDAVVRALIPEFFGAATLAPPAVPALTWAVGLALGVENYSQPSGVATASALYLGEATGVGPAWLRSVGEAFPNRNPLPLAVAGWVDSLVRQGTPATYPLPIPAAILHGFLDPAGNVTILVLEFREEASSPAVGADLMRISAIVPGVLARTDPTASIHWVQTGDAALTANSDSLLNEDLGITVPVTISILIVITILYFRAPAIPLLTLAPIGVALVLGFAGLFLIGTFVEKVHTSALTLLTVFVLGVGTDYSVFLLSRYREELRRGRSPEAAVVMAVTWAGESIGTSGVAIVFATVALAFSGASLLSQWGVVLSVALSGAVLVALTLVPALLVLVGPRIFWPYTRARFRRQATAVMRQESDGRSYFFRVGRFSTRNARAIVVATILLSIPVVYVAANVPLAYDYFGQLPSNQPAAQGLERVTQNFGPGFPFPLNVLVTFSAPFLIANVSNGSEFAQLATLQGLYSTTPGVIRVDSPLGPAGAPLSAWSNFSSAPVGARMNLAATLSIYLGNDGRTVELTLQPDSSGLSNAAVAMLNRVEAETNGFRSTHPDVLGVAYGGAPSITRDIQGQLAAGTDRLEVAVVIGLMVVLLAVLVSVILPPLAVATIGLSIAWAWTTTFLVLGRWLALPLFFYVPVILFIVLMGLGMDYNIFLLTRVREERLKGSSAHDSVVAAIGSTGGVITAAAVILGGAFFVLTLAQTTFLRAIGLAVGLSVVFDAMVVRSYLVPAILGWLGDRVWWAPRLLRRLRPSPSARR